MKLTITEIFDENEGYGLKISTKGLDSLTLHGNKNDVEERVDHIRAFIEIAFDAAQNGDLLDIEYEDDIDRCQDEHDIDRHQGEYEVEYQLDCEQRARDMNQHNKRGWE